MGYEEEFMLLVILTILSYFEERGDVVRRNLEVVPTPRIVFRTFRPFPRERVEWSSQPGWIDYSQRESDERIAMYSTEDQ
jgi:hypothetical protein